MSLTFHLVVTYEDGQTEAVTTDQRDAAAFEMDPQFRTAFGQAIAKDGMPVAVFRWIAWHALVRQKRTKLGWVKWSAEALDVDFAPEKEGDDSADPGQPAATDGTRSG